MNFFTKLFDQFVPLDLVGKYDPKISHEKKVKELERVINSLEERIDNYENANPFTNDTKQEREIILLSYVHKGMTGELYKRGNNTYDVGSYLNLK